MLPADRSVSRRHVLTAAAGVATVGVLVGSARPAAEPIVLPWHEPMDEVGDLIMVRVGNGLSGVLDLFVGTERLRVHDSDLAARIAAIARPLSS